MESGTYKYGTTLVEILVVVAVIVILAGLVAGVGTAVDSYSKTKALEGTFSLLEAALDEYKDFKGDYPRAVDPDPRVNSETLYVELSSTPGSREVVERLNEKVIKDEFNPGVVPAIYEIYDPWGTALNYTYSSGVDTFPKLTSAGPDRAFYNGDDVSNR
ncbi:MAG: hypothetical protein ACYS8Z_15270 [Planctomycetota bacterium]|jgi:type II secretory pathway pseudopilin PulG